jgi:hypothetical protein
MSRLRFEVRREPDSESLEADAALALYAAECVYGRSRVRLEAAYAIAADGQSCTVEVSGEAGEAAARVLAGLLATRHGEQGYVVRRLAPTAVLS